MSNSPTIKPHHQQNLPLPKFDVTCGDLARIVSCRRDRVIDHIKRHYDSIDGLCQALHSSSDGVSPAPLHIKHRKQIFGANEIPLEPLQTLPRLVLDALQDVTIIAMLITIMILTVILIMEPHDATLEKETYVKNQMDWIEGVTFICVAFFVALMTAFVDFIKGQILTSIQRIIANDRRVRVVRNAEVLLIDACELVVGDIILLSGDDVVPADGVLVRGSDVEVDKSATIAAAQFFDDNDDEHAANARDESTDQAFSGFVSKSCDDDPVILACSHVVGGNGRMLVVAVGVNTQAAMSYTGKYVAQHACDSDEVQRNTTVGVISRIEADEHQQQLELDEKAQMHDEEFESSSHRERSILQTKVMQLGLLLNIAGTSAALSLLFAKVISFCNDRYSEGSRKWSANTVNSMSRYMLTAVNILVVSIPEGLPLIVTAALAFSLRRMTKDNIFIRHLHACEAMACVSTIVVDKTGFLTTNRMTVMELCVLPLRYTVEQLSTIRFKLPQLVRQLLAECIALNSNEASKISSTTQKDSSNQSAQQEQSGDQTECALLAFCNAQLGFDYEIIRQSLPKESVLKVYNFDTIRKAMATVIDLPQQQRVRCYVKGAPEAIVQLCSYLYNPDDGMVRAVSKADDELINSRTERMANTGLRTIALAYRDVLYTTNNNDAAKSDKPTHAINEQFIDEASRPDSSWFQVEQELFSNLTLLAIAGIDDPVRPEARLAVQQCQQAGITVRMVTGDNWLTARAVAFKCGILRPNSSDIVIKGSEFNQIIRDEDGDIDQEMFEVIWPRLRVLARSTPADKYTLVHYLMESTVAGRRQVVAVTGENKNDGPTLKRADVGFAMGLAGTDLAKEKCDIIISDDNFASIVKAVQWGRNIYDGIARYVQFQLTAIISTVCIVIVSYIFRIDQPFTTAFLLWINVITDTLAAVALASEPPRVDLLQRKPYSHTRPLISRTMTKNIIGQSIYQQTVVFTLLWAGSDFFDFASIDEESWEEDVVDDTAIDWHPYLHHSFVVNVFLCMTIVNQFNARMVHGERNVFKNLHRSVYFCLILLGQMLVQAAIVQAGGWWGYAIEAHPLPLYLWLWSLAFAAGGLVWQQLVICMPTKCLPKWCAFGKKVPVRNNEMDGLLQAHVKAQQMESGAEASAVHGQPILWMRSMARMHSQFQNIQIVERNIARSYRLPRLHALPNRYRDRISFFGDMEDLRPLTSGTES